MVASASVSDAAAPWDALIIGAGVAGGVTAALLAARGWRVLLVERQSWPREKACGGCLNAAGVGLLQGAGLRDVLDGAAPLTRFYVHLGDRRLALDLPPGVAVARRAFDARLVDTALHRGNGNVQFLADCNARVLPDADTAAAFRTIRLRHENRTTDVRASVVLVCDGVHGASLQDEPWARWHPADASWIGVAATLPAGGALDRAVGEGTIGMFVAEQGHGYVGAVRQADGRTHVGAALSPAACNRARGAAQVLKGILASHGIPPAELDGVPLEGTRPLTGRRQRLAGRRVLVVGDSCGYVEPFTGEGMSWAVRGAIGAAALLTEPPLPWSPDIEHAWQAFHTNHVAARQAWCHRVRGVVRRPRLAGACLHTAQWLPGLARWVARRIGT